MIGQTISHYKILEKISEGGMGIVYKAEDIQLDRIVALKFLPYNLSGDLSEKKRFLNEAKALATLNHPNVATIYGIEDYSGKSFIIMEFVEGNDLRKLLTSEESPKLQLEKILNFAIQIVQGLQAAHNKLIVHRDIKPENIIIDAEEHVKILDFGLAKMAGKEHLTMIGTTMGTVAYMSPEQSRGELVDHRTDIWSFGVILYEMISGSRPFRGDYEQAIIYSILNENPEPLHVNHKHIPEKLEKIVFKTIAKKAADRYENCEELLRDLKSCLLLENQNEISMKELAEASTLKPNRNLNRYLKSVKKQLKISWRIILTILFLFAISLYLFIPRTLDDNPRSKKIAVLPFINMSNNPADEYLSDGIMEDILTQLVKLSDLKVLSRTTMMQYKNTTKSLREISNELNTDVVLEGSVRRDSNKLRVTIQLIDAKTDEHIWADSYDRSMKDVFLVQSEIARQIASELQAKLSVGERERFDKLTTTSSEAYNEYLQGRYFLARRTRDDIEKAIIYFERALQFDSNYAYAWVGLSKAHSGQADMGYVPIDEGYHRAKIEVEKALMLDPNLAEAYAGLGWIKMTYLWDWSGADSDYKRAMELEPGNATIVQGAGVLASVLGRLNEAINLSRQSIELNPLLSTAHYNLGLHYYYAGQWENAKTAVRKALELNSQYPAAHLLLGRIYLAQSRPEEALLEVQKESEISWRMSGFPLVYHLMGKKKDAEKALTEFIKEYQNVSAYQIAEIYAFRGDLDNTFLWLERAYRQRDGGLGDMKGDPLMDNIEKDPRYVVFMKKMNLPI